MENPIDVFCYNEKYKKYEHDEKLSDYLFKFFNNQNLKMNFHKGDIIYIDGNIESSSNDDYIYQVTSRRHHIGKRGSYRLILDLKVIQDHHKGV